MGDSLGLPSTAANLGKQKVNTKRCVLVMQEALKFVNLLAEHLGGVANTTNDTETTGVSDCCGQLGPSSHVHACQQDGVVDLEQIGEGSTDFLCKTAVSTIILQLLPGPRVEKCAESWGKETYEERPLCMGYKVQIR